VRPAKTLHEGYIAISYTLSIETKDFLCPLPFT
jgi:hypothetical protein